MASKKPATAKAAVAKKPVRKRRPPAPPARPVVAKVEKRDTAKLVPFARNSRTHTDEQLSQIARSIERFGFTIPVLIDEDDTILAGHGRVMAAAKLGIDKVPVIVARGWSENDKRAYVIADNKIAANAGWDDLTLRAELMDLSSAGFVLEDLGFAEFEMASFLSGSLGIGPVDMIGEPPASNYKEQYGVIVVCESEAHQAKVHAELAAKGYAVRVVVT